MMTAPKQSDWALFNDKPITDDDKDITRIKILSEQITQQLQQIQETIKNTQKTPERHWYYARFGLFGGLGHGKTSALKQVTNQLENRNWRVVEFDAAAYRHIDLEFTFDSFVHSWQLGRHLVHLFLARLAVTINWCQG